MKRPEVRHLDGSKKNNHYTNLAWGTRRDNALDNVRHGKGIGEKVGTCRLTARQVKYILNSNKTQKQLAKQFNVSKSTIYAIKARRNWKHVSFTRAEKEVTLVN